MTTFNIYRRESNDSNPPVAIATGLTSMHYSDNTAESGKQYLYSVGAIKSGLEKISSEIEVIAGVPWTPMSSSSTKMFLCAEDLDEGVIEQWVCRKTGVAFKKPAHGDISPTNATAITVGGARYAKFKNKESLCVDNPGVSVGGLFSNKSTGYIFVVLKKDYTDTTPSSRRIFGLSGGVVDYSARFYMYADDATANSANKINISGRRLDTDTYQKLSTQQQVDQNTHIVCGEVDHSVSKFYITLDGGVKEVGNTGLGVGTTANTVSKEIGIAGGTAGFDGRIATIVFGNTQLTQLERQKLEGWAAHKYGLTDNLPIDHPYKTLVPTL